MQIKYAGHVLSLRAFSQDELRIEIHLEAGAGADPITINIPKRLAERMMPGDPVYVKVGADDYDRTT